MKHLTFRQKRKCQLALHHTDKTQFLSVQVTSEDVAKFDKIVVSKMVEVLTSPKGYAVMKELSKR